MRKLCIINMATWVPFNILLTLALLFPCCNLATKKDITSLKKLAMMVTLTF